MLYWTVSLFNVCFPHQPVAGPRSMPTLLTAVYIIQNRPAKKGFNIEWIKHGRTPPCYPTPLPTPIHHWELLKTTKLGTAGPSPGLCSHPVSGTLYSDCDRQTSTTVPITSHPSWCSQKKWTSYLCVHSSLTMPGDSLLFYFLTSIKNDLGKRCIH